MHGNTLPIAALAAATALADRAALLRAAEIVTLTVEKRNTYPILANVRLRGDGNVLFLTGTNLDVMIDVAVPAAADPHLDVTVSAHTLRDLLKGAPKAADMVSLAMPEPQRKVRMIDESYVDSESGEEATRQIEEVSFVTEPALCVDFDVARYNLAGLASDSFPDLRGPMARDDKGNPVANYRRFTLPGADLFAALDSVQFAISNEETRYYLNGVYMHVVTPGDKNRPELRFVTTDGHRMARQELTAPDGSLDMPGVIIPKGTVAMLLRLLKPAKGKESPVVEIEVTDTRMRVMFDDVTVTSKTIEGTFPDYERVTPKQNGKAATIKAGAMQEAIKAVSLIASDRGGKAVKLDFVGDTLTLSCCNPDSGTATSSIAFDASDFGAGPFEIGFNSKYLSDMIAEAKADGDSVTFLFNDSGSPSLVRGSRDGWLGVLMPMRV